jgi:hypothetical protein
MALEDCLHNSPLNSAPASMNDAHFTKPGGHRGVDILLDDRWNVFGSERVQVDFGLDRDANRVVRHDILQ